MSDCIIDMYPDKPWDWEGISRNPNITMEFIEANPDKDWNWHLISRTINLFPDTTLTKPPR